MRKGGSKESSSASLKRQPSTASTGSNGSTGSVISSSSISSAESTNSGDSASRYGLTLNPGHIIHLYYHPPVALT